MQTLARLAALLAERNRVDAEVANLIERPALIGHTASVSPASSLTSPSGRTPMLEGSTADSGAVRSP